jgi:choline-sulfatase
MTGTQRPNILFIMADQMKWSILRMYSEIGIETPALERLAEQGVRFETAITPHPLCVPARTSVMTARYPHSTGCRRNETLMPDGEVHAFRIWKEAGYVTGLIGKNHCFERDEDLALFDVRCEISHAGLPKGGYAGENIGNTGMDWSVPEEEINAGHADRVTLRENSQSPRIAYAVTDHPESQYGSSVIATQVESFLDRYSNGDWQPGGEKQPFALWTSFPDPHEPFEVPRRYAEMFPPEGVKFPPQRDDEFTDGTAPERNRILAAMMRQDDDLDEHRRGVISVYQAMTRFVDDSIGRIVEKLESLGLKENTVIVFTADHGDFIGEHGMAVKGGVFYDCLVRVPLVVSWPGEGVSQGDVVSSPVSTIDVLPTLLKLQGLATFDEAEDQPAAAGNEPEEQYDPGDIWREDGRLRRVVERRMQGSPLPVVTDSIAKDAEFSEYGTGGPPFTLEMLERLPKPWGYKTIIESLWAREAEGRRKMVRTERWKYVHDPMAIGATLTSGSDGGPGDVDELYDLEGDPWELQNLAHLPEFAEVISEMRLKLADWMIRTEEHSPVPLPRQVGRPSS